MVQRITLAIMLGLALWVGIVCVRIEWLNAQANFYLPRKDGGADGAWRISRDNTPCDQLQGMIETVGLLQYPSASLLIGLSAWQLSKQRSKSIKRLALCCCIFGLSALGMAFYRGYLTSLGD